MTAIVLAGFPGVGKTYAAKHKKGWIDSDSSDFSWSKTEKGVRDPEFPGNYIRHIESMLENESIIVIFTSTHKEVLDAMTEAGIEFTVACPARNLKAEYLQRYKDRGCPQKFVELIESKWDEFIDDLEKRNGIELGVGEYVDTAILIIEKLTLEKKILDFLEPIFAFKQVTPQLIERASEKIGRFLKDLIDGGYFSRSYSALQVKVDIDPKDPSRIRVLIGDQSDFDAVAKKDAEDFDAYLAKGLMDDVDQSVLAAAYEDPESPWEKRKRKMRASIAKDPPMPLGRILDAVQDGEYVPVAELRKAVEMMSALSFDRTGFMRLVDAKSGDLEPSGRSAVPIFKESHRRWHDALNTTPEHFLGPRAAVEEFDEAMIRGHAGKSFVTAPLRTEPSHHEQNLRIRPDNEIVNEDDTRGRQKGPVCFYCPSALGEKHGPECVIPQKVVKVRLVFEFPMLNPSSFSDHDIQFFLEDSSHCVDNTIERFILGDENHNPGPCSCGYLVSAEVVEEKPICPTDEEIQAAIDHGVCPMCDALKGVPCAPELLDTHDSRWLVYKESLTDPDEPQQES